AFAFGLFLAVCGRDALRPRGREAARRDRMTDIRQERKVVTVLFADLVGFTARAETLDPEDVAAVLRPYHERLRSELERFGGTVEKFIGDAVMALFVRRLRTRTIRSGRCGRRWRSATGRAGRSVCKCGSR